MTRSDVIAADPLAAADQRWAAMYDTFPSGVLIVDPTGMVVYANPAVEAIVGLPVGRIVGHHSRDLYTVTDDQGRAIPREDMASARVVRTGQFTPAARRRLIRADGSFSTHFVTAAPLVRTPQGVQRVLLSLINDPA